jgi:hypothetical protein
MLASAYQREEFSSSLALFVKINFLFSAALLLISALNEGPEVYAGLWQGYRSFIIVASPLKSIAHAVVN